MSNSITERALFQRVSRKLAHDDLRLRSCRHDSRWLNDFGRYYTVDLSNCFDCKDIDLLEYGKELGVIGPDTILIDE